MGDCVRAMSRASVLVMKDNERQCVLVVDDNPLTRKVVRATLEAGGYVVREAQDGQSALAIMAHHSPAVILQDLLLPDMGGFELVTRQRKDELLRTYWSIPDRQIATSVVLASPGLTKGRADDESPMPRQSH